MSLNNKKIDDIVWWIPFKNIRNEVRNALKDKFKPIVFDNIVLITGQLCNLKCKNCANFSPLLGYKYSFYNYKEMINDIKIFTKDIEELWQLQIQGGEIFIHPNHFEILEYLSNNKKIKKVLIATNGMLVPSDKVLNLINSNKKFVVRISNYGDINNRESEILKNKLDELGINNFMHKFILGKDMWNYCGDENTKRFTDEYTKNNYDKCQFAKLCPTMEDGLISICSRATVAHLAQGFSIKNTIYSNGGGYIDVRKKFRPKKFIELRNRNVPVEACYYCYGSSGKEIPAGHQMTVDEIKNIKRT